MLAGRMKPVSEWCTADEQAKNQAVTKKEPRSRLSLARKQAAEKCCPDLAEKNRLPNYGSE